MTQNEKEYFQVFPKQDFFNDKSYLRPPGIRYARALASGVKSLGIDQLELQYEANNKRAENNANILSRYLNKILDTDAFKPQRSQALSQPTDSGLNLLIPVERIRK